MTLSKTFVLMLACFAALPGEALAQASSFEVATIKPTSSTDGHTHINSPPGDSFSAINITLPALMQWAYDMPESQILDGPAWLRSTRFDIVARADVSGASKGNGTEREMKRLMVQALLVERFQLAVHRETRSLPAYDLVVAKGGAKLTAAQGDGKNIGVGRDHFNGSGLTMDLIAAELAKIAGRVVVDKTGLAGRYSFELKWAGEDATEAGPSLFTAIQEQMGLKLEATKEPVPVLVVERVELPSAN